MKMTERISVWETNSSSVHSIAISQDGMEKGNMEPEDDGYIHIQVGSFDKDLQYFWEQREKLSYLLTCCCYMCGEGYGGKDYERLYESYYFRCVEDAILHYYSDHGRNDILGIRVDNMEDAEIDHQSIPEYGEFPIDVNIYNEESIQNFVFNKYVALKTDCD